MVGENIYDNKNDKHHRIEGPAIICGAYREWWFNEKLIKNNIDNSKFTQKDFERWLKLKVLI